MIAKTEVHVINGTSSHCSEGLQQKLRPTFFILKLFGLAHSLHCQPSAESTRSSWTLSKFYSIAAMLIIWNAPLRFFYCYELSDFAGFQQFFLLKIVTHIWLLLNGMNAIIMFRTFSNPDGIKRLIALYDKAGDTHDERGRRSFKRRNAIIITVALFSITVNVVGILFSMFSGPPFYSLFSNLLVPFHKSDWIVHNAPMKLLAVVVHLYHSAAWLLPIMFLMILCFLIVDMQKAMASTLHSCVKERNRFDGSLFDVRTQFLQICDFIEKANDMFQNFIGINLMVLIAHLCLLIYLLVNGNLLQTAPYAGGFVLFWVANATVLLLVLSYGAGLVNDKAYLCFDSLHRISHVNISKDDEFQMNMLMAKHDGPQIGFSAFDLFTIDKASIMTVFGMVLSYLLFMVQNAGNQSQACNVGDATSSSINSTNATQL